MEYVEVNADLPAEIQRITTMREIAHSILHCKSVTCVAFQDFPVFDNTDKIEYEANMFVADFLMDGNAVLDMLNDNISFFGAAARLYVPAELLDFKFRLIKSSGFEMIKPPLMASSDFLKKIWHLCRLKMLSKQQIETRYYVEHRMTRLFAIRCCQTLLPLTDGIAVAKIIEMYHGMNEDDTNYQSPYDPGDF